MANSYNVIDVYTLVNEVAKIATARKDLVAVDTTSFVAVGEVLNSTQKSKESTLDAMTQQVARTIIASRATSEKLRIMTADEDRWGGIVRKLITLPLDAEESENFNTDINPNQLADGQSIDMYKIKKQKVIQLNFFGSKSLQIHRTKWLNQLDSAFTSERELMNFYNGLAIEFRNDIVRLNDARTRAVINNAIGASYINGLYTDLIGEFNAEFGTTYTREQIFQSHFQQFYQWTCAFIETLSDNMTDESALYHVNLDGYPEILHETPKGLQRMLIFKPFMTKAKTLVLPTIFNPSDLKLGDYDTVNFWMSKKEPSKVNVKPTYLDAATAAGVDAANAIELDYVLGMIYDVEFMGVFPKFTTTASSPLNASGLYINEFVHWLFNNWMDETENHHLMILGEGGSATITYNANTGSGTISPVTVAKGSSVTLSDGTGLTKAGYTFAGWATTADAETANVSSPYTVTGNVTLYAVWAAVTPTPTAANLSSGTRVTTQNKKTSTK